MKYIRCLLVLLLLLCCGFTQEEEEEKGFDLDILYDYQKEYQASEVGVCAKGRAKTYMDYRAITAKGSTQYKYIRKYMTVDDKTGFLYDEDGFIGVALGSYYGSIGDRYYFTLDSGIVLPLVKVEEKADADTNSGGCYHYGDNSVIEFVIDRQKAASYFGNSSNGYVLSGNFNNYSLFNGSIVKVEKVSNEKNASYVTFYDSSAKEFDNCDFFNYTSGY